MLVSQSVCVCESISRSVRTCVWAPEVIDLLRKRLRRRMWDMESCNNFMHTPMDHISVETFLLRHSVTPERYGLHIVPMRPEACGTSSL